MQDPIVDRLRAARAQYEALRKRRAIVLGQRNINIADIEEPRKQEEPQQQAAASGTTRLFQPRPSKLFAPPISSGSSSAASTPAAQQSRQQHPAPRGAELMAAAAATTTAWSASTTPITTDRRLKLGDASVSTADRQSAAVFTETSAEPQPRPPPPAVATSLNSGGNGAGLFTHAAGFSKRLVSPSVQSSPDQKQVRPAGSGPDVVSPSLVWLDDSYENNRNNTNNNNKKQPQPLPGYASLQAPTPYSSSSVSPVPRNSPPAPLGISPATSTRTAGVHQQESDVAPRASFPQPIPRR